MQKRHLTSILAVVFVLVISGCAVSAGTPTLKLECANIADTGVSGTCTLSLDSAPNGLSGYDVNFVMKDPSVADLVGDTSYPSWTNIPPVFDLFGSRTSGPNNRNVRVVDIMRQISAPATNIGLGSFQVQGKTRGWTDMQVVVNRMDDDDGLPINPDVANGIVRVGPPGAIMVNSTPKGAKIFINGTDMGATTNNTIQSVPQGINIVSVCCVANYADPKPVPVEVKSGETAKVLFKLARPGKMTITSTPEQGAAIEIDGSNTQQLTNYTFSIRPDTFMVNVSLDGYYNQSSYVTVKSGFTVSKNFVLEKVAVNDVPPEGGPPYGTMIVDSSPRGAQVMKNGVPMSWTTLTSANVAPGNYAITVKLEGYQTPAPVTKSITYHNPTTWFFQLQPALPAQVFILPRTLNIGRGEGKFVAFVRLPAGYKASDVDPKSVFCEGAQAKRIVRVGLFPRIFGAIFLRKDLVNVEPGDNVAFTVSGTVKGKDFVGTDLIKVISVSSKVKEDTDNIDIMKDDDIMKLKPKDL